MSDFKLIIHRKPRFGDYIIKWEGTLTDPSVVKDCVDKYLPQWIEEDSPSIWLRLTGKDLIHLYYFLENGFKMHRIKNEKTLVLNRWIRSKSYTLPPPPFSYIGVGAMCVNDEGKILAIRENFKNGPSQWKIPGGLFDKSKDIKYSDTAIRELFEESGIKGEFESIASQRLSMASTNFKQCDIYTICRLKPLTTEIHFDPIEIAECKWITFDEFLSDCHPVTKQMLEHALKTPNGYKESFGTNYALYSNYKEE